MRPLVLLLLLAPVLVAQKVQEEITVNVVEVPVHVERHGAPVTGLTAADFELFVNGARHPIDSFDVIAERSGTAGDAAAPVALNRRRLIVLLFDVGASSPEALRHGRRQALQYVAEARPGDVFVVATIGRRGGRFVVPFTSDRVAVQRAVSTLAPTGARDPFQLATLESERSALARGNLAGTETALGNFDDVWGEQMAPGGFATSSAVASANDAREMALRWERGETELRDRRFTEDLAALADRLAPLSGVKHVVLLTERKGLDDQQPVLQSAMRMHRYFLAAGVILDAVHIAPPRAAIGAKAQQPPPLLFALSNATGGAVTSKLATLQQRSSVTYVLGFRPRGPQKKTNDIRVKLKNAPMLTDLRYRRAYGSDAPTEADRGLLLADTMLNDIPQNGVTVNVGAKGDAKSSWVTASIPGRELLARSSGEPLLLDFWFYVFDEEGRAEAWNHVRVSVDLEKGREFLSANPYAVRQEFRLEPGRYAVKTLVRVVGTEMIGFGRAEVTLKRP